MSEVKEQRGGSDAAPAEGPIAGAGDTKSGTATDQGPARPADDDYKVGPRRPPKDTRFKKGVSGNPSGRRKRGEDFWDIFRDVAYSTVAVKGHGEVSRIRVLVMQAFADASQGDKRARAECFALMLRNSPAPIPTNDNHEVSAAEDRELIKAFADSLRANHGSPEGDDEDG